MSSTRFWEVDVARGLAVALMVAYHFFFDLNFLGVLKIDFHSGFFLFFQRTVAFLFLSLVGVSLVLFKQKNSSLSKKALFLKFLPRALLLVAVALLITIATMAYPGEGAIFFGVIHFIALSTFLAFLFLDFGFVNLAAGILLVAMSLFVSLPSLSTPFLLWLGFPPHGFYSLDYYPLYPWFGLVLIGVYVGKQLYKNNERTFHLNEMPSLLKPLELLGKNALLVYLIHQPILFGLIKIVFKT